MLKIMLFAVLALCAAGGVLGAAIVGLVAFEALDEAGSGSDRIQALEDKVASLAEDGAGLRQTIADLQGELDRSRERLISVEGTVTEAREAVAKGPRPSRVRDGDSEDDSEFVGDEPRDPDADELVAQVRERVEEGGGGDFALREAVRGAVADIRAEENEERTERRIQRNKERTARRVEEMATRLELQPYQQEELTSILVDRSQARWDLVAKARNGDMDWQDIRVKMEESRDASDSEIQRVLTQDQYAEYKVIEQESGSGWGNWGRGRRRGNDTGNTSTGTSGSGTETDSNNDRQPRSGQ